MLESNKWDCPPNEIMELITSYCGQNCFETKWMFINKCWLNFYLSKIYQTISIDLSTSSKMFDRIVHSPFGIGKWVNCISFKKLKSNGNCPIVKWDDPLLLLMERTPNVEEVEFSCSHNFDASDWTYFSIILMKTKYWKLSALPGLIESQLIYSAHYFACAHYMRHSLKKMNLSLGMMDVSNYDYLRNFPALKILNIERGIVNNFFDLDFVLKSLPNLIGVAAKFSEDNIDLCRSEPKNRYPNINEITLENFTPNLDTEIIAFTKSFPNLTQIKIIGRKNLPWPANEISSTATRAFFNFLSFISEYQITVTGENNAANLMEKWSKYLKPIRKDSLTIKFRKELYTNNPGNVSLTIKNDKSSSALIFNYSNQNYSLGLNALESIKNTGTYVKLENLPTDDGTTNRSKITAFLQKNCPNLETLILKNIFFRFLPDDIKPPRIRLKTLEFYNCPFGVASFPKFTKKFQSLDFFSLDHCIFAIGDTQITNIDMINCKIKTMCISNLNSVYGSHPNIKTQTMELFFLITVYFASKSLTRYYMIFNRNFVEVNLDTYNKIWTSTVAGRLLNIAIKIESIQVLCIKLKNDSEYIKIVF